MEDKNSSVKAMDDDFSFDCVSASDLETHDVVQIMTKCFDRFKRADDGLTIDSFGNLLDALFVTDRKVRHSISSQWASLWFETFDSNGDRVIDWNEFRQMWTDWVAVITRPKSALIVVDVQNDFISGNLALNQCSAGHRGEDVIPVINELIQSVPFELVVYSHDWHPSDHISFFENRNSRGFKSKVGPDEVRLYDTVVFEGCPPVEQKLWPTHCVGGSWGARLHSELLIKEKAIHIFKGVQSHVDSYSVFRDNQRLYETDLNQQLRAQNITDLYFCGIATDFCVGLSALDAIEYGYRTVLIEDASRGVSDHGINQMKTRLMSNNALVVNSSQVLRLVEAEDRPPQLAHGSALRLRTRQTFVQQCDASGPQVS